MKWPRNNQKYSMSNLYIKLIDNALSNEGKKIRNIQWLNDLTPF